MSRGELQHTEVGRLQVRATPSTEAPPSRFGRFTVLDHLASAGMSTVYLGQDTETGARVAIKTSQPGDLVGAERLRAEIGLLTEIEHPGVIPVLDHGVDDRAPWYAMPYLGGGLLGGGASSGDGASKAEATTSHETQDLAPRRAEALVPSPTEPQVRPVDWDALRVVRELCGTLAWLHGRGVIHRDLKPSNILLDDDRHPVLIDFGITARFASRGGREMLAHDPASAGTRGYMAPEQKRGDDLDPRADLFALGCILYRILVGVVPSAPNGVDDAPRAPHLINPDIPEALSDLVMMLLADRPQDRVGYAVDVGLALEALGVGKPREGQPAPRPYLYRPSFVGHEALLSSTEKMLEAEGKRLFLVGPSGAGKTRMAQELIRRARSVGREVVMAPCGDSGLLGGAQRAASAPLLAFRPFLRRVAERCLQGNPRALQILGDAAEVLAAYEPLLAELVGSDAALASPPKVGAGAAERNVEMTRARLQAAMTGLLDRYAQQYKPLIVIDDVQWADEISEGVIRRLVFDEGSAPAATLLLTQRSEAPLEDFDRMASQAATEVLEVPVLSPDEVKSLAQQMLADPSPPAGLLTHLIENCAGNPFFVAAYLNESVQNGSLVHNEGWWRFAGDATTLSEPRTLAALLTSRLDHLELESHRFVDAGCVLGRRFAVDDAAALAGTPRDQLREIVDVLRVRQVLERADDRQMRFAHDKLLEHAYDQLAEGQKRELHAAAAALLSEREDASTVVIARHLLHGGAERPAFDMLVLAAEEALGSGRHKLARALLADATGMKTAQGARLFDGLPLERREAVRLLETRAAFAARDHQGCLEAGAAGLALRRVKVPSSRLAVFTGLLRAVMRQVFNRIAPRGWVASTGAAGARARGQAEMWSAVAFAKQHRNEMPAYLASELNALNLAEQGSDFSDAAHHLAVMAYVMSFIGARGVGNRWFDRAVGWAQDSGDEVAELVCRTMRCAHHLDGSEWEAAEREVTLLRERCRHQGADEQMTWNTVMCLLTAVLSGQIDKARGYADELRELSRVGDHAAMIGEGGTIITGLYLQTGEHERARAQAAETIALLRESGEVALRACCMAVTATIDAREGHWAKAWQRAQEIQHLLPDGGRNNFQAYHVHTLVPELLLDLAFAAPGVGGDQLGRADVLRCAKQAMEAARHQAKRRPLLWPNVIRQEAKLARLQASAKAPAAAERAVARAREANLLYELGMSLSLVADLGGVTERRQNEARREAIEVFEQLGCQWDLARLKTDVSAAPPTD